MRSLLFAALLIVGSGCTPPCSSSTCDGCCDDKTNTCLAGRDVNACGHDGEFCGKCLSTQMCVGINATAGAPGKCQ